MDKKISGVDLREIDSDILSVGAKKSTQRKGDCEIVLEKTGEYQTNKANLSERQNIVFHLKTGIDCGNIASGALLPTFVNDVTYPVNQVVPVDQTIWEMIVNDNDASVFDRIIWENVNDIKADYSN